MTLERRMVVAETGTQQGRENLRRSCTAALRTAQRSHATVALLLLFSTWEPWKKSCDQSLRLASAQKAPDRPSRPPIPPPPLADCAAYELGTYGTDQVAWWGTESNFRDPTAVWIWATEGAEVDAATGVTHALGRCFTLPRQVTARIHLLVDNAPATVYYDGFPLFTQAQDENWWNPNCELAPSLPVPSLPECALDSRRTTSQQLVCQSLRCRALPCRALPCHSRLNV